MKTNFEFLCGYWPDLANQGKLIELYLYNDLNKCIETLYLFDENILKKICIYENIEESNEYDNILEKLKEKDLLPEVMYSILKYVKSKKDSINNGVSSNYEEVKNIVILVYKFSLWFSVVYGECNISNYKYIELDKDKYQECFSQLEQSLKDYNFTYDYIFNNNLSYEERRKRSSFALDNINFLNEEYALLEDKQIVLEISSNDSINYSLNQNGIPVISNISIINNSSNSLSNIELMINSDNNIFEKYIKKIDYIPQNEILELKDIDLKVDSNILVNLTEKITCTLIVELKYQDSIICSDNKQVEVLAFDQWSGISVYPEIITSFIMPNHPEINQIIIRASEYLNEWTNNPSFDAYQSNDYNRVIKQVGAVYSALQEKNIIYVESPASFEKRGQRIRLCDAVLSQHLGNCLDLTLLYASVLEAIGLNTILIFKTDHVFLGVWLENVTFSETILYDKSLLSKKIAEGVNELIVIESTCMVSGNNCNFDEAQTLAKKSLMEDIVCFIDVKRTREAGIIPLPIRIMTDNGWNIERKELKKNISNEPTYNTNKVYIENISTNKTFSKKEQWERKLLDLSLRNSLINLHYRSLVPIFSASIDEISKTIMDGKSFSIQSIPNEIDYNYDNIQELFEQDSNIDNFKDIIISEFKNNRLRTRLKETDLENKLKNLYRTSRQSIQENGANTLYLALGLLRWYESDRSIKPIYAPLILIPVELVKKIGNKGYNLRVRDEEAQINITVLEKLNQDFDININGLEPLPTIDNDIDIRKIFTIIRNSIMKQNRWDVLETAYLGIFSFSQFVMWNDIRNRTDDLINNKIVKSLIDGKISWDATPIVLDEKVDEEDVLTPIELDSSQLKAVKTSIEGKSFVLHGPPGTGKSQTITAIISNLLARGKTVLFVAEKQAALEVVQKRLEDIGIGEFCLELHSNKSKKSEVLSQMESSLNAKKSIEPSEYSKKLIELNGLKQELDKYATALHKTRQCGYSVYELINLYEKYKEFKILDNKVINSSNFNKEEIDKHILILERLISSAKTVEHPYNHPLSDIHISDYSLNLKNSIIEKVNIYKNNLYNFKDKYTNIVNTINLSNSDTYNNIYSNIDILNKLNECLKYPRLWTNKLDINNYINKVINMSDYFMCSNNIKNEILKTWNISFLQLNATELLQRLKVIDSKFALIKYFEKNKLTKELKIYSINRISKDTLEFELNRLLQYQINYTNGINIFNEMGNDLESLYCGDNTNWYDIKQKAQETLSCITDLDSVYDSNLRVNYILDNNIRNNISEIYTSINNFISSKQSLYNLLEINDNYITNNWFEYQMDMCNKIENNLYKLREWCLWNNISKEAINNGLQTIVNEYNNGLNHDEVINTYYKNVYYELLTDIIDSDSDLNTFHGILFDEKINQFKDIENKLLDLAKVELYYKLSSNIPNFITEASKNSEVGTLKRAIQNHGRGISIRDLFNKIPNLLHRLCPCMLMSPISVAQYLDTSTKKFDYVIFDEASQLTTSKAVGTLARGDNAIIVGDPKQMPPTSFFVKNIYDEEYAETEDLESILDDCLALNIPDTHLLWHYRSRHESLISFSNKEFYDSKLYTFPSINERESRVSLVNVNGIFERNSKRYNKIEAKAIIDEIKKICHDPIKNKYSVGIVTFNIPQQNLIEDLLNDEYLKDSELEKWSLNTKEPIFIKNLENVQGDERDIILFSVGYGPDENNNIYMNFGPLNREGGWRRLNVAVSRARYEMKIFSSLSSEDIDLSRTRSRGVEALKNFLEYASGKKMKLNEDVIKTNYETKSNISTKIVKYLKSKGYDCDKSVGTSKYRIDVGIIDPNNKDKYILGILLDGNNYKNAHSTRDREVAHINILKSLGWNIHRIWSLDWFDNSEKECEKIIEVLQSIKQSNNIESMNDNKELMPQNKDTIFNQKVYIESTNTKDIIPKYEKTQLLETKVLPEFIYHPAHINNINDKIDKIISKEAPITLNFITRRIFQSFGISRTTTKMNDYIYTLIQKLGYKYTKYEDEIVYWNNNQDCNNYYLYRQLLSTNDKREIKDIPIIEIANATCYILFNDICDDTETLIRGVANILGYTRLGNNVISRINNAINYCCTNNRITKDTQENWILTDNELEIQKQLWN